VALLSLAASLYGASIVLRIDRPSHVLATAGEWSLIPGAFVAQAIWPTPGLDGPKDTRPVRAMMSVMVAVSTISWTALAALLYVGIRGGHRRLIATRRI
jgi:hypothetical protein